MGVGNVILVLGMYNSFPRWMGYFIYILMIDTRDEIQEPVYPTETLCEQT